MASIRLKIGDNQRTFNLMTTAGAIPYRAYEAVLSYPPNEPVISTYQTRSLVEEIDFIQNDWSRGMGEGIYSNPLKFATGKGIDCSHKNKIFPGPAITTTTKSGGGDFGAAPSYFCRFLNELYCATTTTVWKWNTTTSVWDSKKVITGQTISCLEVFGAYMHVGIGAATKGYYTADGANYTQSTLTDGYINHAVSLRNSDGNPVLWKTKLPNEVSSSDNPIIGGTQWTTAYKIGNTRDNITSIIGFGDRLLVGKEEAFYHLPFDGKARAILECKNKISSNNFKPNCFFKNLLYFAIADNLGEVSIYDTFDRISPLDLADNLNLSGTVKAVEGDMNWLYVVLLVGTSYILYRGREDENGWLWMPWVEFSTNACAAMIVNQGSGENARLWFGYANAAAYVTLSDKPLDDSSYKFVSSSELETGKEHSGYEADEKIYRYVEVYGYNLRSNRAITVFYKLDDDESWTFVGSVYKDGLTRIYLPSEERCHYIRWKLGLETADSAEAAELWFFRAVGQLYPKRQRIHEVTIGLSTGERLNAKRNLDFLLDGRDKIIELTDPLGVVHQVRYLPPTPEEVIIRHEAARDIRSPEMACHLKLLEVETA